MDSISNKISQYHEISVLHCILISIIKFYLGKLTDGRHQSGPPLGVSQDECQFFDDGVVGVKIELPWPKKLLYMYEIGPFTPCHKS